MGAEDGPIRTAPLWQIRAGAAARGLPSAPQFLWSPSSPVGTGAHGIRNCKGDFRKKRTGMAIAGLAATFILPFAKVTELKPETDRFGSQHSLLTVNLISINCQRDQLRSPLRAEAKRANRLSSGKPDIAGFSRTLATA